MTARSSPDTGRTDQPALPPPPALTQPTRRPDVIYVPTPYEVVDKMLEMADVRPGALREVTA